MKKLLLAFALSLIPLIGVGNNLPTAVTAQPSSQTGRQNNLPTGSSLPSQQSLLSPDTRVNYTQLQKLLAQGQWRTANDETFNLVLKAVNRQKQGWATTEDLKTLACWDLSTIDRLWKEYSQGQFGFTPQLKIFLETGNRPGRLVAIEKYEDFGDRIGWRSNNDWIRFKENLNFSLNAPQGHLPALRQEYQLSGGRLEYSILAQRMVDCNLVAVPNPPKK